MMFHSRSIYSLSTTLGLYFLHSCTTSFVFSATIESTLQSKNSRLISLYPIYKTSPRTLILKRTLCLYPSYERDLLTEGLSMCLVLTNPVEILAVQLVKQGIETGGFCTGHPSNYYLLLSNPYTPYSYYFYTAFKFYSQYLLD